MGPLESPLTFLLVCQFSLCSGYDFGTTLCEGIFDLVESSRGNLEICCLKCALVVEVCHEGFDIAMIGRILKCFTSFLVVCRIS